jgi:polysaccharide biosynthesis transport protein
VKEISPYLLRRSGPSTEEVGAEPIFLDPEDAAIDLTPYLRALRKHIWLVTAIVAVPLILTAVYVYTTTPEYTAETTLLIRSQAPEIYEPKDGRITENGSLLDPGFLGTQCAILKSRVLALDVIHTLHLDDNPEFIGTPPGRIAQFFAALRHLPTFILSLLFPDRSPSPPEARLANIYLKTLNISPAEEKLIKEYLAELTIVPPVDTTLVTIRFTSTSPELAARAANAHAQAFILQGIKIKSQTNEEAEKFLRKKLVQLRKRLEQSEIALNDYRQKKGIIPGLMSLDGRETVVLDRLTDLSKDLTTAQVQRIGLEAQVQTIHQGHYESLPSVVANTGIQTLKGQLDTLLAQYAGLADQFTPNYPPVAEVKAKVEQTRRLLKQEILREVRAIQSAYDSSQAKERKLQAEMDKQRTFAMRLNDAAVQYAILQRDVDTNRQLYNSVLQRMKDVGVAAEAQTSNASVVDQALPPTLPSSPKKARDLLLTLILSLTAGITFALVLDYFDVSLKSSEEAENYLRLPNLSAVPDFSAPRSNGYLPLRSGVPQLNRVGSAGREIVESNIFNSLVGESYRHLRTALLLSRAEAPPQVSLFTSATAGEGKTVTAVNTAIMLAQFEGRVLLIDADLRRSRCHNLFGFKNGAGLTEVLTGNEDVFNVIRPTCVHQLSFLSAGITAPNPTELLGSHKMKETLGMLREMYQYIVLDSPPVIPVSDAIVISTMVDGVVMVVRAGKTSKKHVKLACTKLKHARAKIFGTVLNQVQVHSSDYTEYYHYSSGPEASNEVVVS